MSRTVIIIRHAGPEAHPDRSPASWPLSPAGRIAAAGLNGQLPSTAFLTSSREVKAIETLSLAAGVDPAAIHQHDHFGEVHRPAEPFDDDHRARRRAWVEGRLDARHELWETPDQAGQRFQQGLEDLDAGTIAVATHGMVLTAWLVAIGRVEPGPAAGEFWAELAFPEILTIKLP